MKRRVRKVAPGRYEGDGIIIVKKNLYGRPWQTYRVIAGSEPLHEHSGSYGSLEETLFHTKAEVSK